MKQIDLTTLKGAIFSEDGKHRYALWRLWSLTKKPLMFIGLNPSTANGSADDPTITRLMARAAREGYGSLLAGNLFALVSTIPSPLAWREDAVGDENDEYLLQMINMAGCTLCAWGSFPEAVKRSATVLSMVKEPYCLGVNADGNPKHPLYISYEVKMERYQINIDQ